MVWVLSRDNGTLVYTRKRKESKKEHQGQRPASRKQRLEEGTKKKPAKETIGSWYRGGKEPPLHISHLIHASSLRNAIV